jgi:hypothetical protein
MKTTITPPRKKGETTVTVTFEHGGVTHTRPVNAVFDDKGKYDAKATTARVADVARGIEQKIAVGAITNPPSDS